MGSVALQIWHICSENGTHFEVNPLKTEEKARFLDPTINKISKDRKMLTNVRKISVRAGTC